MSKQCTQCKKFIVGKKRGVQCTGACKNFFDTKCAKLTNELFELIRNGDFAWRCSKCLPLININDSIIVPDDLIVSGNQKVISNKEHAISLELSPFDPKECTMDKMAQYLKDLGSVVMKIHESQNYISMQMDDIIKHYTHMQEENKQLKKKIETVEIKTTNLEKKVNHLESLLDREYQKELRNNIVIAGLPQNIQDKKKVILQIASKINANINSEDIQDITLLKSRNENDKKNPLWSVKLNSEFAKNEMMAKKRSYKHLFTAELNEHLTQNGNHEIFFRHHLSQLQAKLYYEAKTIKANQNMEFLWIKNGNIFLRKNQNAKIFSISNYNDIHFIKNTFSTGDSQNN